MSDQTEKTDIKALIELCPTGTSLSYNLLLQNAPVLFIKCLIGGGGEFDDRSLPGGGALDHYS